MHSSSKFLCGALSPSPAPTRAARAREREAWWIMPRPEWPIESGVDAEDPPHADPRRLKWRQARRSLRVAPTIHDVDSRSKVVIMIRHAESEENEAQRELFA